MKFGRNPVTHEPIEWLVTGKAEREDMNIYYLITKGFIESIHCFEFAQLYLKHPYTQFEPFINDYYIPKIFNLAEQEAVLNARGGSFDGMLPFRFGVSLTNALIYYDTELVHKDPITGDDIIQYATGLSASEFRVIGEECKTWNLKAEKAGLLYILANSPTKTNFRANTQIGIRPTLEIGLPK